MFKWLKEIWETWNKDDPELTEFGNDDYQEKWCSPWTDDEEG